MDRMSEGKHKRASSEWRRARSRAAARSRRWQESQLFLELAAELPVSPGPDDHLDKASVIRLVLTYLRLRAVLNDSAHMKNNAGRSPHSLCPGTPCAGPSQSDPCGCNSDATSCDEKVLDSALGGFMLLVSHSGQVIYATEAVSKHIGINQMDLMGHNLFHFMHPCDLREVRDILSSKTDWETQKRCDLFLRMKCTMRPQGRTVNLKSASWKVLHCTGVRRCSVALGTGCLVLLCQPLPNLMPSVWDACLNRRAFLSRHTPDMRFSYCQPRVSELIGYTDTELLGQSVYQYYHTVDCQRILKTHLSLFSKGKACTGRYRLLVKNGGFVWVETNATVVYSSHSGQPQSVICINYILSEVEHPDVVFSLEQKQYLLKPSSYSPFTASNLLPRKTGLGGCSEFIVEETIPSPVRATRGRMETEHSFPIIETLLEWDREKLTQKPPQKLPEEDLDTLAPYIPMDGEDFLLTPIPDEGEDKADMRGRVKSDHNKRILDGSPQRTHEDCSWERHCNGRHFPAGRGGQQCGCHSWTPRQPATSQWKKIKLDPINYSQIKEPVSCWWSSGESMKSYQSPLGFVPWAPQYSDSPNNPPDRSSVYSSHNCVINNQHKEEWTESVLPVLSPLECEVNAPVGPASCLLHGTEILSVLDQAACRLSL